MIRLPRVVTRGPVWALALYSIAFVFVSDGWRTHPVAELTAVGLFIAVFVLCVVFRTRMPLWAAIVVILTGVALPLLATSDLDPSANTFSSCGWYISAVGCLGVSLLNVRRARSGGIVFGVLVVHTLVWAGPAGLIGYGVIGLVLLIGVGAVAGWALERTEGELERFHLAEREAVAWRAAQDAYHFERQVRLGRTSRVGARMLHRIVEAGGRLTEAERQECRVLEQTIRDEIRGRGLLNDALRREVLAARRRGAVVQVLDDGGLDDLDGPELDALRQAVAEAIAPLTSNRIVIRTAAKGSESAITIVATTVDPTAAALGLDDEEEVDLWLALDRPTVRV